MKVIFMLTFFMISHAYAIECEWWQTKYSATTVNKRPKKGKVREHPRREYCREKWKHSDKVISTFKESPPTNWSKNEKFKPWTQKEIRDILKAYEKLPEWLLFLHKSFHRAEKSSNLSTNPAASDKTTDSVTIYDEFYKRLNQEAIVGHEMAHLLFKKLSVDDKVQFNDLSGWTLKVEGNQVFEIAPPKVIINDSVLNKEEDFANLIEVYLTDPAKLKSHNTKLFNFFEKRFPK
jgi:hypothetical protein